MRHLSICLCLLIANRGHAGLPAFPGAVGFGTDTPGGRGGRVLQVTTLADSGPGSLRAALTAPGPRTVVFTVAGIIDLKKDITVREPFLTIAGQTAPGDGVCVRGAAVRVATHDVVVRFLRVRVGDAPDGPDAENRDGLAITSDRAPPHHVVLDHCSVSWAIDENIELWHPSHDLTISWCLISESLERAGHPKGAHGMGLLVGDHARRVSVHHNLFAHHMDRSPLLKGDTEAEVINNVIYNWRNHGTALTDPEGSGPQAAVILANLYLPGPQTRAGAPGITLQREVKPGSFVSVRLNRGPGEAEDAVLNRSEVPVRPPVSPDIARLQARVDAAERLPEIVLPAVGATRPRRDAVDERVVEAVRQRGGRIINSQREVGGWPDYASGPPPRDRDGDGLPDDWETAHGLDPSAAADGARLTPSGYSWLEVYLAELAGDRAADGRALNP